MNDFPPSTNFEEAGHKARGSAVELGDVEKEGCSVAGHHAPRCRCLQACMHVSGCIETEKERARPRERGERETFSLLWHSRGESTHI
jgi:hypothetical protein